MHLSEHYPAFPKKTLLVLTNNELAKLYACHERDVEELAVISTPEIEPVERVSSPNLAGIPDLDAAKQHRRQELYTELSEQLHSLMLKQDYREIILCVPEANKNELVAVLNADVAKRIKSLVPKNLASMELGQVLRILFEA